MEIIKMLSIQEATILQSDDDGNEDTVLRAIS